MVYGDCIDTIDSHVSALASIWSMAADAIQAEFHTSAEVTVLGISVYVIALATGPLFIAPLSEFYGRNLLYRISLTGYFVFQCLTAFGHKIESLIIGRALTGFFGSGFLSNVAGSISDLFWRWVFYVFAIWTAVNAIIVIVFIDETYAPILLVRKAERLRKLQSEQEQNEFVIRAPLEIKEKKGILITVLQNTTRPITLLVKEPIMLWLCFYTGFEMAILYFFFVAFPLVFGDVYKFNIQEVG